MCRGAARRARGRPKGEDAQDAVPIQSLHPTVGAQGGTFTPERAQSTRGVAAAPTAAQAGDPARLELAFCARLLVAQCEAEARVDAANGFCSFSQAGALPAGREAQ